MNRLTTFVSTIWRLRLLLRFSPFDTDTEEGRAMERHRRMLFSTSAAMAARVVSISAALISIPLTLHYLSAERYGMWLTISSFILIMSFADLGMGNGLLNRIAVASGRDDRETISVYVSSAFWVLTGIAALACAVFLISYSFVPWYRIFNVRSELARSEAGPSIAVFAICFALSIPSAIVQKVQVGLQGGFVASLWQIFGNLLSLSGIVITTRLSMGLPILVLSLVGTPLVIAILNSVTYYFQHPDIRPRLGLFSRAAALDIAKSGILFLVLQIVGAMVYASDPLIIAHLLGPSLVPQFSVPERMFSMVAMIVSIGLTPLWPAYGEALSRGDRTWVRETFFRSLSLATGVSAAFAMLLVLSGPTLLRLWVGRTIHPSLILLIGLAVWKVVEAASNAFAMFLNAAELIRFQVIVAVLTGLSVLLLKFLLIGRIGVAGGVWASALGYTVVAGVPLFIRALRVLKPR